MTNIRWPFFFTLVFALSVTSNAQEVEKSSKEPVAKISTRENLGKDYVDTKMRKVQVGKVEVYRPPKRISRKYSEGDFLIYDCKERHFACVDPLSYEKCENARKLGLDTKAEKVLACAPLKKFSNFYDCAKEQYALQHRRVNKAMCLVELGAAAN